MVFIHCHVFVQFVQPGRLMLAHISFSSLLSSISFLPFSPTYLYCFLLSFPFSSFSSFPFFSNALCHSLLILYFSLLTLSISLAVLFLSTPSPLHIFSLNLPVAYCFNGARFYQSSVNSYPAKDSCSIRQ